MMNMILTKGFSVQAIAYALLIVSVLFGGVNDNSTPSPLLLAEATAATITCTFTVDNNLISVYLDDVDVTGDVTPQNGFTNFNIPKIHTFTEPSKTYTTGVMYAFKVSEEDADSTQFASGFLLKCTSSASSGPWHNLVSAVDDKWSAFASTTPDDSGSVTMVAPTVGDAFPNNWYSSSVTATAVVGESTSGFNCPDGTACNTANGAKKIWVEDPNPSFTYKYAGLRVFVPPPTPSPTLSPSISPTNKPTINPSTITPSISPTLKPTMKPIVPCGGSLEKDCNKMAYCKWKKVDKKKTCVPYDCTKLSKKQCGKKKKGVCEWDPIKKCVQVNAGLE